MDNVIENYRRILFPYAYNILGTVEDAEDAIQDVIIKFLKTSANTIENPKNYLIKSVINYAIQLKRKQNKTVRTDIWLPEPVITDNSYKHQEILNFSLLARMEHLNTKERTVFILKEGLDHSHEEIGEMLSYTPENSRQILSRARKKLKKIGHTEKVQYQPFVSDSVKKLIDAIQNGDTDEVKKLLSQDIQFYADGGNNIQVAAKECMGNDLVSQLLIYVYHTYNSMYRIELSIINHQPAILYMQDNKINSCQVFEVYENKIIRIDSVIDPEKLKSLNQKNTDY